MTPEDLDAFLTVARKHGQTLLRVGDVVLSPPLGATGIAPGEPLVPFEPGAPPVPKLEVPKSTDPVGRWDEVDRSLWPEGTSA